LKRDELDRYLRHRLAVAGFEGETLFTAGAVAVLHTVSGGTPRLVNIIAHKSLLLAFGKGHRQVQARHVRVAAADTPEAKRDWQVGYWVSGFTAALVLCGASWFWLR